jgi:PAS domain S-box-containing protein
MSNKPTYEELEQRVKELEKDTVNLKQIAEALRKEGELFVRLVNNSSELIYRTDQTGKIAFVSQSVKNLTGYTVEEAIGMHMAEELYLNPKERDRFLTELNQNGLVQNFEVQLKRKNNSIWWGSANSYILKDDNGNIVGAEGLIHDITKRKQSEDQVRASLKEKDTLLHEIHHRVKNNMTVISSLLKLQMSSTDSQVAKDALQDSQNRVQSMSKIHETLYRSDNLAAIDLKTYLSELGGTVFQNYSISSKVQFKVEAENIMIDVKPASTVGLIVNELITNCLKYAFPDDRKGEMLLELKSDKENGVELSVSDNGVGISEGFDLNTADSLGLKLVKMLTENQLDGSIAMESINGAKFTVKFNIEA